MRRTRVDISPANIHREGGQIVNFTFFSAIFFLEKIPIILKSIFDIPQICYANFVLSRKESRLTRARFSDGGTFSRRFTYQIYGIIISGPIFLVYKSVEIVRIELARMGNGGKRNFTTGEAPVIRIIRC